MSDNDTPTPLTDAVAAHDGNWDTKFFRMKHHAEWLERQLAEAKTIHAEQGHKIIDLLESIEGYKEELAEARRDKESLLGLIGLALHELEYNAGIKDAITVLNRATEDAQ